MIKKVDPVSLQRIEKLHPADRRVATELLIRSYNDGIPIRYTSTLRNWPEQDLLYAKGRTAPGHIVTWAKSGESYHNYGLALDFCLLLKNGKAVSWSLGDDNNFDGKPDFMQIITIAKSLDYESGSDWPKKKKDYPHLQMTHGLSISECRRRYSAGLCDKDGYLFIQ